MLHPACDHRFTARPRRLGALVLAVAAACTTAASAGPVQEGADLTASADPYEQAARWTVASLSAPQAASPALIDLARKSLPKAAWSPFGHPLGADDDTAQPAPYALLGLALLGLGLMARRLRRPQRGFSKKT